MLRTLYHRQLAASSRPRIWVSVDLLVLFAWLAVFGVGLRVLVGWPAAPSVPQQLPSWTAVQIWLQSPGASLQELISVAALLAWVVWFWTLASVLLRMSVDFAEALTRGARWVGTLRLASDWLTLPVVRRAVDASLAGLLFARVVAQPVVASANSLPSPAVVDTARTGVGNVTDRAVDARSTLFAQDVSDSATSNGDVVYVVRPGDTLSGIALAFYGDSERAENIYERNLGRLQPDGRQFNRHGLIIPGWTLLIPGATEGVVQESDGSNWYVVQRGDTLSGIADRVLGDEGHYPELFALNVGVARLGDDGPVLQNADLIWPGLRLRLPDQSPSDTAVPGDTETSSSTPEEAPQDAAPAVESPVPSASSQPAFDEPSPTAPEATVAVRTPVAEDAIAPTESPTALPSAPSPTRAPAAPAASTREPVDPKLLAGAGAGAAAVVAGALIVRRRKRAPFPSGPETDVRIESGFAEADPVEGLARRLAKTSDPPTAVASLMAQSYATIFAQQLTTDERQQAGSGVTLVATRHGRTSTTLTVSGPVAARPYLVRSMQAAAEHAFGPHVDVDGLVSHDGDVLVRLTWDSRRPVPARVLEMVGAESASVLWPTPFLVRLLVGYDRQPIDINWHSVSNVLIASPTGQAAGTPLVALLASLASERSPEDLGFVLIARPHTLADEVALFPHCLMDSVDAGDAPAVERVLEDVRHELDRRAAGGVASRGADVVVVVREICDPTSNAMAHLHVISASGPVHGIRLVMATERPVSEALQACPFLHELGTRVVLRARDEEESVALIGAPGAEELGRGGHALLRFEGRMPVQGWACSVPPDHLARLLSLMGTRAARPTVQPKPHDAVDAAHDADDSAEAEIHTDTGEEGVVTPIARPAASAPAAVASARRVATDDSISSPLLRKLRCAPIRVRCFGARDVVHGDRVLELREVELLLLLAAHPVRGIQSEALADMLWEDELTDSERALRVRRSRLRKELRSQVPELMGDPLPGDAAHGERVVVVDPEIIGSDVHEFLELLQCARKLEPRAAIRTYEEALSLYGGDLLDAPDVPNYRWMYDGPQIALTLRSDYRRQERDARLRLAELLAAGPETGLARAEELYSSLCAEDPEDERLWTALFRVHERAESLLGLESAVRKLRFALAELASGEPDVDTMPLPPKLNSLINEIRDRLGSNPVRVADRN